MKPIPALRSFRLRAGLLVVMALVLVAPYGAAGAASEFWFRDVFDGEKDAAWSFYVPGAGATESFDVAGYWTLEMETTSTIFDHWTTVDNAPALYLDIPSANQGDDFFIETHLVLEGPASGNFHGAIVVYFSQFNVFYWGPYMGAYLRVEKSGQNGLIDTTYYDDVYLRIERTGSTYRFLYTTDPTSDWILAGTLTAAETPTRVGLMGKTWGGTLTEDLSLGFDYFVMNAGMGAYAGPDQVVLAGDTVTLDGSRSYADTFSWQQVSGEPTVALSNANPPDGIATFEAPDVTVGRILTFRLTTTAATGTTTDDINITVRANSRPMVPPSNLEALAIDNGFILSWDPLIDADLYAIERAFEVGGETLWIPWATVSATSFSFESLNEGELYKARVIGRNVHGDSDPSEVLSFVPFPNRALATGPSPPSSYLYTVSHYPIAGMNDGAYNDNNDSWDGQLKSEDYWGYMWDEAHYFQHIVYCLGYIFADGAWFTDLTVQYTPDGVTWLEAPWVEFAPEYDFTDSTAGRDHFQRYDISFATVLAQGIRVYGTPGGGYTFTSISEMEVYGDQSHGALVVQGRDGEALEYDEGVLDASASFSTRGDVSGYHWEQVIMGGEPTVTIENADSAVATFVAPGVDEDTVLVFSVTAGDGVEEETDDDVRITVKSVKTTAVAGADRWVIEASEVSLDGTGSVSSSGTLSYAWTQVEGEPEVEIRDADQPVANFTAPTLWGYTKELTFQLQVNDGLAEADSISTNEVVIEVRNSLTATVYDLETGYFKDILHLGTPPDDRLMETDINVDYLAEFGGEANINPREGDAFDFTGTGITPTKNPLVWTPEHAGNGLFGGVDQLSNMIMYWHIYIISPDQRDARFHFRHDDDVRGWNNGAPALSRDGYDVGVEQTYDFTLYKGLNSMTFKLHEGTGGNYFAAGITDPADAYYTDLNYALGPAFILADAYAARTLPASYQPGGEVEVTLSVRVNPDNKPSSLTVSEAIPAGLTVVDKGGGTLSGGNLEWTLSERQVLTYRLGVPAEQVGVLHFEGTVSFPTTVETYGDDVVYEIPSPPRNLDNEMFLAAHLSWSASSQEGVVGYRVYRSASGGAWEELAYIAGTSYMDDSVVADTDYRYRVSAVNINGKEGSASEPTEQKRIIMETREAENFNYGQGQYPWEAGVDIAAVEAPSVDATDPGDNYDFWQPHKGGPRLYRPLDDIGIETVATYGLHTDIGWIGPGSWWRYTFDVPEPGWIKLVFRVASPLAQATLAAYWDETLVGTVTFAGTGDWQLFTYVPLDDQIETTAGVHTLRVEARGDDPDVDVFNFDKIGVGYNWSPPKRKAIFEEDFEKYTNLYVPDDVVDIGGWGVENGSGEPVVGWRLWSTAGQYLGDETEDRSPDLAGMTGNYIITDSDLLGEADLDEELISPEIDCTNWIRLRLDFDKNFRVYFEDTEHNQIAEVDARVWDDDLLSYGGWINLLHLDTSSVDLALDPAINSSFEQINLSAYDEKTIQLRWRFYDASWDWWFAVDNIVVSGEPKAAERGVVSAMAVADGKFGLTWNSFGGGNYTVQYKNDLSTGEWLPVEGGGWPTTETSWPGEDISGFGNRFYRVMAE